jgi:HSP20 family protein
MFALMPWRKARKERALLPRGERVRLMDEFDTLFERLLGWPLMAPELLPERPWGIETEETDKEVVYRFELPGFELPELDVRVLGGELIVEARHEEPVKEEKKVKEKEPEPERRYGHVREVITLPPDIDPEKVEAKYHSGVLEVRIPRLPEAKGRRIEVKV